jgi:hypothetical protein
MANYYCEYCGQKFSSVSSLTACSCVRHPLGTSKGKHSLYQGSEKAKYTCRFCGQSFTSLASLTGCSCVRHPNGTSKGHHSPAL